MVGVQKQKIRWAISLLLVILYFSGLPAEAQYGGGSGESNDPYLIYTAAQMNAIGADRSDWDKHFKLMADIDLAAYSGTQFNIIGIGSGDTFSGVFDGNGKKISNFNYTSTSTDNIGLFGYVSGANAQIKDLGLIDPDVHAGPGRVVGSLVGYIRDGTISNCYVEGGSVSGGNWVGGLVGRNQGGAIIDCHSSASVSGGDTIGGLVGSNSGYGGTITNSYSTGSVSGDYQVGGLVGYNYGTLTNCYATSSVSGRERVGGLVGSNGGTIANCYSTGSVTGSEQVGGLVGYNYYSSTITNCYSLGSVTGNEYVGGLVGGNFGTIINCYATGDVTGQDKVGDLVGLNGSISSYAGTIANCYSVGSVTGTTDVGGMVGLNDGDTVTDSFWDTQTSGQATSACGTGLPTAEMQMESTFIVWGGDNVWTIDEGIDYPRLWWENKPGKLITKPSPLFGGGSGTKNDPFLIYTAEQLNTIGSVRGEWDKHFKLMADIDLSDFADTDFNIIGNQVFPFTGVFDGSGHTISNFSYTSTGNRIYIGLFGYVSEANAQIKDLGLIEPNIDAGRIYVGSLVGELRNGTVTGCYVEGGSVSGDGGLVGSNGGTIYGCYFSGHVSGSGGLVGWNSGRIIECHSSGEVSGHGRIGGLVGQNSGIITNCYSSASVSGDWYFGGLVGDLNNGIIANCYSTGSVSVRRGGGGGGLVGHKEYGAVYDSFWDIQTSGQTTSYGGTGLPTAEMQMASTFIDSGWDFVGESVNGTEDIWWFLEGQDYPRLWWELLVFLPDPPNGAVDVIQPLILSWVAGGSDLHHDIYFGEDEQVIADATTENPGIYRGRQPGEMTTYDPGTLELGKTYYWRIDEVNDTDPNSPWKGPVWSFMIQPRIAYEPTPADGAKFIDPNVELNWTGGLDAELHYVYFGDNFDDVNDAVRGLMQADTTYSPGTLEFDKTYYWRVDESDDAITMLKGDVWSFKTLPEIPITDPNLVGWWTLDEGMGTTAVDWSGHGNHGTLYGNPQRIIGYDGDALDFDGSNDYVGTGKSLLNNMSQFTLAGWVSAGNPEAGRIGLFGQNDLVEFGFQGGDIHIYTSGGGEARTAWTLPNLTWHHITAVGDGTSLTVYVDSEVVVTGGSATASYGTAGFTFNIGGGGVWDASGNWFSGQIDDVRVYDKALTQEEILLAMRGDPLLAGVPNPTNGSTPYIREATPLNWLPGDNASGHDVYFGIDRGTVADANASDTTGVYRGQQVGTSYTPPDVEWGGGPYYWRIDEYNTDATISEGRIWSFTVADFIVIEDFEDYNDFEPDTIFDTWLDGWGVDTNGSEVGYAEPVFLAGEHFVETNIVHGGSQSMPYSYDTYFKFSEATYSPTQRDWTEEGVEVLSLWFYGDAANAAESMYVALNGSAGVYHGNSNAPLIGTWTEWTIDLQEFIGVNLTNVNTIAIGFGDKNNLKPGGSGLVLFDDIRLYRSAPEPETP